MSVILFIIILAVLVLFHELGHFLAAKKAGVRVDEFGLGFPPRLWATKKGETEYSINLIPLGGFVKIYGENPDEESISGADNKRSLVNKSRLTQAWVLFAGVFFNFLLAWLLVSGGLAVGLPAALSGAATDKYIVRPELTVTDVLNGSPAAAAGLKVGDRVLSLSDNDASLSELTAEGFRAFISTGGERPLALRVSRPENGSSTDLALSVTPQIGVVPGAYPAIGVSVDRIGTLRLPFYRVLWDGLIYTLNLAWVTMAAIFFMITEALQGDNTLLNSVTGPVGLVGLVGSMSSLGWAWLLNLTAVISINLAVLNLVPFPALDGGRLFLLGIEAIKRKRLDPQIANLLNSVGFIILIILMLVVTYRDITRLFVS